MPDAGESSGQVHAQGEPREEDLLTYCTAHIAEAEAAAS